MSILLVGRPLILFRRRRSASAHSLAVRSGLSSRKSTALHPIEELQKRVQALDEAIESEVCAKVFPVFGISGAETLSSN